jgi:hypothetical protein
MPASQADTADSSPWESDHRLHLSANKKAETVFWGGVRCVAREGRGWPPMRAPPRRAKAPPPEERRADVEGCGRWAWSWAIAWGAVSEGEAEQDACGRGGPW